MAESHVFGQLRISRGVNTRELIITFRFCFNVPFKYCTLIGFSFTPSPCLYPWPIQGAFCFPNTIVHTWESSRNLNQMSPEVEDVDLGVSAIFALYYIFKTVLADVGLNVFFFFLEGVEKVRVWWVGWRWKEMGGKAHSHLKLTDSYDLCLPFAQPYDFLNQIWQAGEEGRPSLK